MAFVQPFLVGLAVNAYNWLFEQTADPLSDRFGLFFERVALGSLGAYEERYGAWPIDEEDRSYEDAVETSFVDADDLWPRYVEFFPSLKSMAMAYAVEDSLIFDEDPESAKLVTLVGGFIAETLWSDAAKMGYFSG